MDTEYEIKQKNKKTIFFLLVLGAFGFLCFKYAKVNINIDISKVQASITSASTCTTITDNSTDNTKFVNIAENGTISDATPSVLGTQSSSANSCTTKTLSTADSKCTSSTNSISVNGKTFLASDVTITLDSVIAPIVIFSGSSNNEIQDSNRNNTGIYKPLGEQYDKKQILVNTTPGENNSKVESQIDSTAVKTSFGTQYSLLTSSSSSTVATGNIVVNKYVSSDCKECNNISNPNPEKSNTESSILTNIKVALPGQTSSSTSTSTLQVLNACQNKKDADFLTIKTTTCVNTWNIIWGKISSIFSNFDWSKCDPKTDSNCVSAEDLIVKMSPIANETNGYMKYRNLTVMNPTSASGYTPVYVLTSCVARITDKETGSFFDVDVKCAWDSSYLFYENDALAYDDIPGSKSTLSTDAFIKYLQNDSIARSSETLTSM